jgi:glucan-binding YG repeat protein
VALGGLGEAQNIFAKATEEELAAAREVVQKHNEKLSQDNANAVAARQQAAQEAADKERQRAAKKAEEDARKQQAEEAKQNLQFHKQADEMTRKTDSEDAKAQYEAKQKKEEDDKKWLDKEQANLETNGQKTLNEWRDEEHEEFMIKENEKKMREDAMNDTVSNLQFLASKHKEWGAAYKAMAIAQATIDTYKSAEAVFTGFSTIPVVGLELGIAGAAVAVAAGIANIQQIANQKFATGTYNAPGGYAMVGEMGPEMAYIPRGSQIYTHNETRNMTGGTEIHLHLPAGASVDYSAVDRLEKSLPRLLEGLADTNALRTFKSKLAKV